MNQNATVGSNDRGMVQETMTQWYNNIICSQQIMTLMKKVYMETW